MRKKYPPLRAGTDPSKLTPELKMEPPVDTPLKAGGKVGKEAGAAAVGSPRPRPALLRSKSDSP